MIEYGPEFTKAARENSEKAAERRKEIHEANLKAEKKKDKEHSASEKAAEDLQVGKIAEEFLKSREDQEE